MHEYAHNLMKWHGISLVHWERHLANPEAPLDVINSAPPKGGAPQGPLLFNSPIVKAQMRPMGACLSAWYSYVFVGQLLVNLIRTPDVLPDKELPSMAMWLDVQRKRVQEGIDLINQHVETTGPEGDAYFGACVDWAGEIVKDATFLVAEYQP